MATVTKHRAYHAALTAASVDTVTLDHVTAKVEIINRSGTAEIYYTLDGTAPTVAGDDCYVVPAAISSAVRANPQVDQNQLVVKLISSGTPTYSVQGVDNTDEGL